MNSLKSNETAGDRIQWYQSRIDEAERTIALHVRKWKQLSTVRGSLFLISLFLLISGAVDAWQMQMPLYVGSGIFFLAFLAVVFVHEGIESKLEDSRIWLRLYRRSQARLKRDWAALPVVDVGIPSEHSAFSNDLDLFGSASLFQLIGGVGTPMGVQLLKQWMLSVPGLEEVAERQTAVQELKVADDFRDRMRFLCHRLVASGDGPTRLREWSEAPRGFDRAGIWIWVARVLAVFMFVSLLLTITGLVSLPTGGAIILGLLTVNFLLTVILAGRIHTQFNQVSQRHGDIQHYEIAFRHLCTQSVSSKRLADLNAQLQASDCDVLARTSSLGRIAWCANLRRNGMAFFAWMILHFCFLWDFHIVELLQQWKSRNGKHVGKWFDALGQWEVLAALAQFARDHQSWCLPLFVSKTREQRQIDCVGIGHPLLPATQCVSNDAIVGPAGRVLLVTGSNMSGKSTLLRAIGANTVLAQLGAPVCAKSMTLSPMRIETSMRIEDSLADGVSFFMAELKRLKQIVDVARQYESRDDCCVLFLLDEILQGTNSRERHIAVTRVVSHLIRHGAIGCVSTHDLELGTASELKDACRPIHFRESFETIDGQKRMTFDYVARNGIATTTNALELLKLVGLDEPN